MSEYLKREVSECLNNNDNGSVLYAQKHEWNYSFLEDPEDNNSNENKMYYVAWFPSGPLAFKNLRVDMERQAKDEFGCVFEQNTSNTIYSSYVKKYKGYSESRILKSDDRHIEYIISSENHGNIGVEFHLDGIIIFGISGNIFDKEKKIIKKTQEDFKDICNQHIFSIMNRIQLDMMVYSEGSGIQKTLNPPGKLFVICKNDVFNPLQGRRFVIEGKSSYEELKKGYVFFINENASASVISYVAYFNMIQSLDYFINEIFKIIWAIWGYSLEKMNKKLLAHSDVNDLKLILERTGKINKDLIDFDLLIKYISDVIENRTRELYELEITNLIEVDITSNEKIAEWNIASNAKKLEWKRDDLRRILASYIDYHNKINELISLRHEEISSKSEKDRTYSMELLTLIFTIVFIYPLVRELLPKSGYVLHIAIASVFIITIYFMVRIHVAKDSKLRENIINIFKR